MIYKAPCNGRHAIRTHVFVRLLDTKSCIGNHSFWHPLTKATLPAASSNERGTIHVSSLPLHEWPVPSNHRAKQLHPTQTALPKVGA